MSEQVAALLKLEQRLRKASSLAQSFYTIVNETHECVSYSQAILVIGDEFRNLQVVSASDIPTVDYTSPFVSWIEQLAKHLAGLEDADSLSTITPDRIDKRLRSDWQEMSPPYLLWLPLKVAAQDDRPVGALLLFREEPWSEAEKALLEHLSGTIAHALFALRRGQYLKWMTGSLRQRKVTLIAAAALCGIMWLPVRLSALAPAEVIPKDPLVITSPIDGAVRQVKVLPNQAVKEGDLLVQFEDTELASELEVSQQALLVAQAELKTVQQSGFLDPTQKARLAELESTVRLRQAELAFVRSRYEKAQVASPGEGIAVLGDPNEWQGRPVSIGERLLLLADPGSVELQIMLPVKDSIALSEGAPASVFFDNDPLHARSAVVRHAEYEPTVTPDDLLAYRLVAEIDVGPAGDNLPRIGTRGTAKVYGESVTLFFYLFRRPITTMRQWLGW